MTEQDGGSIGAQPLDRRGVGGDFVLQDFRQDVDEHLRGTIKACRVEKEDPTFGYKIVEGHDPGDPDIGLQGSSSKQRSVGDIFPWLMWPQEGAKRPEPSWNPCFAAVVIQDSQPNDAHNQPDETRTRTRADLARRIDIQPRGDFATSTQTAEGVASRLRRVLVLPVHTRNFDPDARYKLLDVAVPPNTPRLTPGTPGVVLAATREREQVELFIPSQAAPLISVNHSGDPEMSSTVYDLLPTNELDPARAAQLHTAWRVIPVDGKSCDPRLTPFPILAWQLGRSGQDRHAGCGLVSDAPGGALAQPTEDSAAVRPPKDGATRERGMSDQQGTQTRERGSGVGEAQQDAPGVNAPPGAGQGEAQAINQEIERLQQRRARAQSELTTLSEGVGQNPFLDAAQAGPLHNRINALAREVQSIDGEVARLRARLSQIRAQNGTRTNPPGQGTDPRDAPTEAPGLVSACASSKLSGPLEVGIVGDPHQLGIDKDGNPINALHIATSALFRGGVGDAPMDFENVLYTRPSPMPLRSPGHLRIDPDSSHRWACGNVPGLWRFEVETAWMGEATPRGRQHQGGQDARTDTGGTRTRGQNGTDAGAQHFGGPGAAGTAGVSEDGTAGASANAMGADGSTSQAPATGAAPQSSGLGDREPFGPFWLLEKRLGLPAGSLDASGNLVADSDSYLALVQAGKVGSDGVVVDACPLVGDNDQTIRIKLGGTTERYATAVQCVRHAGGSVMSAVATAAGEVDLSHGGFIPSEAVNVITTAPDIASTVVVGYNPRGTWDGFRATYTQSAREGARGITQGVVNFGSPEITAADYDDADNMPTPLVVPVFNFALGASIGFGSPDKETGSIRDGYLGHREDDGGFVFESVDATGTVVGSSGMEAAGHWGSDAFCAQARQDGTTLPAGSEYFYVEDGANLAAGTPAFRQSGGGIASLAGGGTIGGGTGAADNRMIRSDGVGGSTVQSSAAYLDDNGRMANVTEYGFLGLATDPNPSGVFDPYYLWVDDTTFASPHLFFKDGTANIDLTAAGGEPFQADGTVIHFNDGTAGQKEVLVDVVNGSLPLVNADNVTIFLSRNCRQTVVAGVPPTSVLDSDQRIVCQRHEGDAVANDGQMWLTSFFGGSATTFQDSMFQFENTRASTVQNFPYNYPTMAITEAPSAGTSYGVGSGGKIGFGLNQGNGANKWTLGSAQLVTGGDTGVSAFIIVGPQQLFTRTNYFTMWPASTNQTITEMNAGNVAGALRIPYRTDAGANILHAQAALGTTLNNGQLSLFVEDCQLWGKCAGTGAVINIGGGGSQPGQTVTEVTSTSGSTIQATSNETSVPIPGSGSAAVTVAGPFIPGLMHDLQVVISVALIAGVGLTQVSVGDGTDVDRYGILGSLALNTSVTRDDWTILNERNFGIFWTVSQAAAENIVLTPDGDWGGGGPIFIIVLIKQSTIVTF